MNGNKLTTGAILLALGIILLLINLGHLHFSILFGIFDLWPLILVVVGVNILLKKRRMISLITWTLFFIILLIYGGFYKNSIDEGQLVKNNINIEKHIETTHGQLHLGIGAAKVNIASEGESLLNAGLEGRELAHREKYKNNKEIVALDFESKNIRQFNFNHINSNYRFHLNKDVIWDLDLDLGAVSGKLDLKEVPVKSMNLDFGAGDIEVILGNKYHKSNIKIDSGASNLIIAIPKDVGIKLKLDTALTKTNLEDLNLNKSGDYYLSSNYEEADIQLDFDIDMGAGRIDFQQK